MSTLIIIYFVFNYAILWFNCKDYDRNVIHLWDFISLISFSLISFLIIYFLHNINDPFKSKTQIIIIFIILSFVISMKFAKKKNFTEIFLIRFIQVAIGVAIIFFFPIIHKSFLQILGQQDSFQVAYNLFVFIWLILLTLFFFMFFLSKKGEKNKIFPYQIILMIMNSYMVLYVFFIYLKSITSDFPLSILLTLPYIFIIPLFFVNFINFSERNIIPVISDAKFNLSNQINVILASAINIIIFSLISSPLIILLSLSKNHFISNIKIILFFTSIIIILYIINRFIYLYLKKRKIICIKCFRYIEIIYTSKVIGGYISFFNNQCNNFNENHISRIFNESKITVYLNENNRKPSFKIDINNILRGEIDFDTYYNIFDDEINKGQDNFLKHNIEEVKIETFNLENILKSQSFLIYNRTKI